MDEDAAKNEGGVSMDFASILHVLALIGVYILNLLIYEVIIVVIWLVFTFAVFKSSMPERKSDAVMRTATCIALLAFALAGVLLLLNIGCIVSYPA